MARRRYQMGRIILRGKRVKKWIGRYREDEVQPDGTVVRIEKSVVLGIKARYGLETEKQARRAFDLILARINNPAYRPVHKSVRLDTFITRWQTQVMPQHKPSSQYAERVHINRHILPELGSLRLDEISVERQQTFVTKLSQRVSHKMMLNVMGTLASIMITAKRWGQICIPVDMSQLVLPPRPPKREPVNLTPLQVESILGMAREPYATMFAIAALAGLRAGEILGLRPNDIDLVGKIIHIRQSVWRQRIQSVKSKASVASVPVPSQLEPYLCGAVSRYNPNQWRLLFLNRRGKPYDDQKVRMWGLHPVLDKLTIPRCGLHAFRHFHASMLSATGASPAVMQAQLRHSDPRVTLGIYTHLVGNERREAVERIGEILRPKCGQAPMQTEAIQ